MKLQELTEARNVFTRKDYYLIRSAIKNNKILDRIVDDEELSEKIVHYFMDEIVELHSEDIPYGVLTGDTGTPDEWLYDRPDLLDQWINDNIEHIAKTVSNLELS